MGVSELLWYFVAQFFLETLNLDVRGVEKESSLSQVLVAQVTETFLVQREFLRCINSTDHVDSTYP